MSEHTRPQFKITMENLWAKVQQRAGLYTRKNPLAWAFNSLRTRGLRETFGSVVRVCDDLSFDLRFGTDTVRWVEINSLRFESAQKKDGLLYIPSSVSPLRSLLRKLDLPKDGVFIDFGSGKGRVLLIAAQSGFQRVTGVEYSPELCQIARENIRVFLSKTRITARMEVVESDAANYAIDRECNVIFLFNPFEKVVLTQVLANLRSSLTQFPRKVWVIYNYPVDNEVLASSKLFSASEEFKFSGIPFPFRVYQT